VEGTGREWVEADRVQQALYLHWPPFTITGRPGSAIRLPPGDHGRVIGLADTLFSADVPRVSPRQPTRPNCIVEPSHPWVRTGGTIGRAIRGVVRFDVGERVRGTWAEVITDLLSRVAISPPGRSYGSASPRGRAAGRGPASGVAVEASSEERVSGLIESLLSESPPQDPDERAGLTDDRGPMTVLIIDHSLESV
jgi:hypothetical protein